MFKNQEKITLDRVDKIMAVVTLTVCAKQYEHSRNFIIPSIPPTEDDVETIICKLLYTMKIAIKREEITAHWLSSKGNTPPVLVQCISRAVRDIVVCKS